MTVTETRAIVLRLVEFSETSLVVTLLTRDFGRLTGLAKGARRPKGPFEAALDLLNVCHVLVLPKSGEALALLTAAKLERRFRAGQRDLARLYAAYFVVELLMELTHEGEPQPELFALAELTLHDLDGNSDVTRCLIRFQLQTLRILGHLPRLDSCVVCGGPVSDSGAISFGFIAGGLLCARCSPGERQRARLSGKGRNALLAAVQASDQLPPALDTRVWGEVHGVLAQYVTHLLGRRPKLLGYAATWLRSAVPPTSPLVAADTMLTSPLDRSSHPPTDTDDPHAVVRPSADRAPRDEPLTPP
jgi:DNA repair protein RecO (recombination protein O)